MYKILLRWFSIVVLLDNVFLSVIVWVAAALVLQIRDQIGNLFVAISVWATLALKVKTSEFPGMNRRLPMHYWCLVISILLEKLLHTIPAQEQGVFLYCLLILPVVVVYMFLVKVIILVWGDERGDQPFLRKALPWEVLKPGMSLYFWVPVQTETIWGLALQTL